MKSFTYQAFILALLANIGSTDPVRIYRRQEVGPVLNKTVDKGCYKSVKPFEDLGEFTWQTVGYCQEECVKLEKPVMALFKGSNCLCGEEIPRESDKTTDDKCQEKCDGYPEQTCGGTDAYHVHLTGLKKEKDVPVVGGTTSSEGPSSTSSTTSKGGETVVVTSSGEGNKGPNKAGIAAGVVVGVVCIGAIIGGAFFFLKYKKRKAMEEEHRRNATISSFVAGGKPYSQQTSMSDSRLDPSIMSQRRQSNGSIADDQDFSRRILKVTNPDGGHY
ncbi:hypothetical protein AJ79_02625 [Helicocarpus griseus UAMH5409]|uniref:WSC domain-containing protein n=1 Tax=Helicocarpus griseus UAMH5409 TaxID=1447875 RepID=A0A2B7Y1S9_9EURO|nr:hypothetical protein AJ79_02625 [Helicocarpus griseus UAMH5409]